MELYIDDTNLAVIREYAALSFFAGVTTTPTFFRRQRIPDCEAHIKCITEVIGGLVHVEALGSTSEEIVAHARRNASISDRVVSKIPISKEGLRAAHLLKKDGLLVNVHLVFSVAQAVLAAEVGADYVCPLIGRLNDIGGNGWQMIRDIAAVIRNHGYRTKVMASSIRVVEDVTQSLLCGADALTLPARIVEQMIMHPLTQAGVELFWQDALMGNRVSEVMRHASDMPIMQESSTLLQVMIKMTEKQVGIAAAVDAAGVLTGVVTDGDIRRCLHGTTDPLDVRLADIMNTSPVLADSALSVLAAIEQMEDKRITQVVVVDSGNHPVGYVSLHDVLGRQASRRSLAHGTGSGVAMPADLASAHPWKQGSVTGLGGP